MWGWLGVTGQKGRDRISTVHLGASVRAVHQAAVVGVVLSFLAAITLGVRHFAYALPGWARDDLELANAATAQGGILIVGEDRIVRQLSPRTA